MPGLLSVSEATVFDSVSALPLSGSSVSASRFSGCASPYDASSIGSCFATHQYVQRCEVGSFIDLVLFVKACEEKEMTAGDSFLEVYGIDIDGHDMGPIRLRRFGHQDVEARVVYIIRGLKVVMESGYTKPLWSNGIKYFRWGHKSVEASWRTAIENVSEVPEIFAHFDWLA